MNALIVGKGQIGRTISQVCESHGDRVAFFSSSDDRGKFASRAERSDVIFLAIPTRDIGEIALGYILDAMRIDSPIVTCEKGSLAYHFDEVRPYLKRIGYMASVGGGSRMLSLLSYPHMGLERIVGIVNGTLNFLFSECARGTNPDRVLDAAQRLGLCEPGNSDLAAVVNGELIDTTLKAVVLFNCSGVSDLSLSASELGVVRVSEGEVLAQLVRKSLRFAVSIGKKCDFVKRDSLYGCLHAQNGDWHVEVGLFEMSKLPFCPFPERQQNSLVVIDDVGPTQIFGLGAGPIPTAAVMVADADRLVG